MPMRLSEKEAQKLMSGSVASQPKYRNRRSQLDGEQFDSAAERNRWAELLLLQRAGQVREVRRQVPFQLAPPVRLLGASRQTPALRYVADFVYEKPGPSGAWLTIIEDCKGAITEGYRIKRHLMKALLGHDILETRAR